jgi:hypothetical protein
MTNTTLRNIAIVGGIVLFVPAFVISPALGVVLAVILIGAFMAAQRILGASEVRLKKEDVGDLLNRMWIPVRDELSVVVRTGGRVTSATSVWSGVPNLYKQEAPTTFHEGMERYVNERAQVAALVASVTATLESRQQQEIEQQKLLFMSRELLEEARKVINFIPGSETAVRRAEAARPRPSAPQTRSAATRPSAGSTVGTAPAAPASRSAQAQTATPVRTISWRPEPSRPAPASMRTEESPRTPSAPRPPSRPAPTPLRVTDTPKPLEPVVPTPAPPGPEPPPAPSVPRPAPTPLRITDTPKPPEPVLPTPAPPEPEPPSVPSTPPVPFPVTASVTEPAEPPKPPEPAVVTPSPREPEPVATRSEPPGDLRLDVASVCEALFDPKIMSYESNRLFDDRYKDATVRWKGTTRRANVYSYDFDFGDGGGTKAEFDIYEVKQQYGSRTVKAFVQLPEEAADEIGARIGEDVQFEGRLISCEGSARRLYVADARMVD